MYRCGCCRAGRSGVCCCERRGPSRRHPSLLLHTYLCRAPVGSASPRRQTWQGWLRFARSRQSTGRRVARIVPYSSSRCAVLRRAPHSLVTVGKPNLPGPGPVFLLPNRRLLSCVLLLWKPCRRNTRGAGRPERLLVSRSGGQLSVRCVLRVSSVRCAGWVRSEEQLRVGATDDILSLCRRGCPGA